MSARFMRRAAASVIVTAAALNAFAGEIILFEESDFRGNSMRITSEVDSLDGTGMNDRAQSAIVRDGVWEVCRDANFNGGCIQMPPGRYSRMDGNFVRNVSSVREVGSPYMGSNPAPYTRPAPPQYAGGCGRSDAVRRPRFSGTLVPDVAQRRQQSRPDRFQRSSRFAACHERLLGLLQRRQLPGRMQDVWPRRIPKPAARVGWTHLIGATDLQCLPVLRPAPMGPPLSQQALLDSISYDAHLTFRQKSVAYIDDLGFQ